jgi:hypothetical protein
MCQYISSKAEDELTVEVLPCRDEEAKQSNGNKKLPDSNIFELKNPFRI